MFCVFLLSLTHVAVPQREPAVPVHDKESEPTFSRTHNTSLGLLLNYGVLFKIPSWNFDQFRSRGSNLVISTLQLNIQQYSHILSTRAANWNLLRPQHSAVKRRWEALQLLINHLWSIDPPSHNCFFPAFYLSWHKALLILFINGKQPISSRQIISTRLPLRTAGRKLSFKTETVEGKSHCRGKTFGGKFNCIRRGELSVLSVS